MQEKAIKNRVYKFRAWDKKSKKWIGKSSLEYLCVGEDTVVLVTSFLQIIMADILLNRSDNLLIQK